MKSSAILRVLLALLLALVPAYAPATAVAGEIFNWTGEASTTDPNEVKDWDNIENWDDGVNYPGETATTDEAVIDDPSPQPEVVQDTANLIIGRLFVGDGHTLKLDEPLEVTTGGTDEGEARFEGNVDITGDSELEAQWVWVNSKEMPTEIRIGPPSSTATLSTTGG